MAKRPLPGDTNRSKTVTTADLEELCSKLMILNENLSERIKTMKASSIRSVRFDGGGMGENSRKMLASFCWKLGEAIETI
jgi:hypothetical protein